MSGMRTEHDSMGPVQVPQEAYYGAQTQRAVENFPISGYRFGRGFIRALGLIKYAAAMANESLGRLDAQRAAWIKQAAREVADGRFDDQFVVDVFQTGSGTSTNMNANEVIANRANELAGAGRGSRDPVHPNDHVNMGQSSNDVIPTAMHVAAVEAIHGALMPALHRLCRELEARAAAFDDVVRIARTHLQDATPIRMGQVFSGYAAQVAHADRRLLHVLNGLRELPIGGTAVGTGINTHPDFGRRVCEILAHETGEPFREAANHFEAQHAKDAFVEASGAVRGVAVTLIKIANDIRWLGSGPRCGLGELRLPAVQPGSSIMPGKVNPVICEALLMACTHAIGADAAVCSAASLLGNFELHVGMPVMAWNLLEAVRVLAAACGVFVDRCASGLEVDRQRCAALIEQSLALATALVPWIGYDRAAQIAKQAWETGRTVREVAREAIRAGTLPLSEAQLEAALDVRRMTEPQADGGGQSAVRDARAPL